MGKFNFFRIILFSTISLSNSIGQSQSTLTIPEIMKGNDFTGWSPKNIQWSEDSKSIYFNWNPDLNPVLSHYEYDLLSTKITLINLEDYAQIPPSCGTYNDLYTQKTFSNNGDLFLLDIPTGKVRQITNTIARESSPVFSGNGKSIIYQSGDNLFRWYLESGTTEQITNFAKGEEKKEIKKMDQQKWLEDDQMALFDVLNDRKEIKEARDSIRDAMKPIRPKEFYLNDKSISSLTTSPDCKFITFRLAKTPKGNNRTKVADGITESGYTDILNARPKVGSPEDTYSFHIYDIDKDTIYTIDTKMIPGIYDKPAFLKKYAENDTSFTDHYEKPRKVIIHGPFYNSTGSKSFVVIRAMDNKDRWIMMLDPATGEFELIDRQRDEAWIGGPGIGEWNSFAGTVGWLGDDKTIYYQSEETGYSHLYLYDCIKNQKKQITSGEFEIRQVKLSKDKNHFYIRSNREDASEIHFYKMPVKGGKMKQITSLPGFHEVSLSPDEKHLAIRYSYSNKPWELYIMENKPGAEMKQITHSTTKEFNAYAWRVPDIVEFKAEDGATLRARLYAPDDPIQGAPAVIFVHGAGYLQNVHKWWSSYSHEYMFHNFLVDRGYTVLDIDYRGSDGYGHDWRTGVYRHMGGKDLSDHVDGTKYLIQEHGIDPDRIGIYGGSYGGFITIFAMFKYPEIFACGAALRSVTDWAHYNHGYTSNRLNTPVEDSIAYKQSSPIYFAEGLKGELLMLHGTADTNVHFQDVVRLSQKLIELGKENWNVAVFPVEGHGFRETSSWTDEYRRIFELFERNLKE